MVPIFSVFKVLVDLGNSTRIQAERPIFRHTFIYLRRGVSLYSYVLGGRYLWFVMKEHDDFSDIVGILASFVRI